MPRGRPRKPRLSRMDAAVDAMAPFGFPTNKVKKHVRKLLKVYGGDDGWPFIEEYSYKELIEAMLRDVQEDNGEEEEEDEEEEEEAEQEMPHEDEGAAGNIAEPKVPEIASSSRTRYGKNALRQKGDRVKSLPPSNLQPANGCPPRRRMHCHGWIESNEDEKDADDFLVLKRMPIIGNRTREKRTRWDM